MWPTSIMSLCSAVNCICALFIHLRMTICNGSNVLYIECYSCQLLKWSQLSERKDRERTLNYFYQQCFLSQVLHSKQVLGEEAKTINCQISVVKVTGSDTGRSDSYKHEIEYNSLDKYQIVKSHVRFTKKRKKNVLKAKNLGPGVAVYSIMWNHNITVCLCFGH